MQEQCTKENENGPSRPETEFRSRVNYNGMLGLFNHMKSDNFVAQLTRLDNIRISTRQVYTTWTVVLRTEYVMFPIHRKWGRK